VYAGFVVDVADGAYKLGKDLLYFGGVEGPLIEEVVVKLIPYSC
jgi:hypothetical protein